MTSSPFSGPTNELGGARLVALEARDCAQLAEAIAAMPPWSVMNYPADALARFLASSDGGVLRYLVEIGGEPAGAVSVRYPWLKGPYLELLAILPAYQGAGVRQRHSQLVRAGSDQTGGPQSVRLHIIVQHARAWLLWPPRLSAGSDAARPGRRGL